MLQYDPSTPRTVTEIQAAREKHKEMKERRQTDAIFLKGFDFEDNSMQTNGAPGNDSESDSANEMDFVGSDDDTPAGGASATSTAARPSIAELRANLQARKAGSTTGSTVNGDESVADAEGTSEGKEALLAERKRQSELRERRRKSTKARIRKEKEEGTSSSFKGKQKESMSALPLAESSGKPPKMSDIKKQLKKEGKRQFFNFDTEGETSTKKEVENAPAPSVSIPEASSAVVPHASTSAAPAPSSSIAFSSLDFAASSALNEVDAPKLSKKQREALGKNTKLGLTSHNPTVALSALNKRTEFLSKLTPEARERAEEKDKWERMAMRAEGTKVYDDEAKLKKMLKKKEKSKDKSRKDWYVTPSTFFLSIRDILLNICTIGLIARRQSKRHKHIQQRREKRTSMRVYSKKRIRRWVSNLQRASESKMQRRRADLALKARVVAKRSNCLQNKCKAFLGVYGWSVLVLRCLPVVSTSVFPIACCFLAVPLVDYAGFSSLLFGCFFIAMTVSKHQFDNPRKVSRCHRLCHDIASLRKCITWTPSDHAVRADPADVGQLRLTFFGIHTVWLRSHLPIEDLHI